LPWRVAFEGADAVFLLLPPNLDPASGFAEEKARIVALSKALTVSVPKRVVFLSTIGAQVKQPNLLQQSVIAERAFGALTMPVTLCHRCD
jgi:uncharacterized protein YbjT (DUF2867 family)